MTASAETPVKPVKERRVLNLFKGLAKIGFACAALLMMYQIYSLLKNVHYSTESTKFSLVGIHQLLIDSRVDKQETTGAAAATAAVSAGEGGMATCSSIAYDIPSLFSGTPSKEHEVLRCNFNHISLKPSSYCGYFQDAYKDIPYAEICLESLLHHGWKLTHYSAYSRSSDSHARPTHNFIFEK